LGTVPGASGFDRETPGNLDEQPGSGRILVSNSWESVLALDPGLSARPFAADVIEQVTIEAKYDGYIGRQVEQIERFRRMENKHIPRDLDYSEVPQLRAEARERFERVRPHSLGQAGRISGISPADIATLLIHLKRNRPEVSIDHPTT
jgi:tRNA uridine 5-carboxymethylaminomethyl modification enzyme